MQKTKLIFQDGTTIEGKSFGYESFASGEIAFTTGMVGYPESLTDPSYKGQILVMTYPLIGNYGVPDRRFWESNSIHVSGLIVSNYIDTPSHFQSTKTLSQWLKEEKIPALEINDTRAITQKIRDQGTSLVQIIVGGKIKKFQDPNKTNLVDLVSQKNISEEGSGKKTILLIDCGVKTNIKRSLLKRNVKVITVPWSYDFFDSKLKYDGILISNGPGDPKLVTNTIDLVKKAMVKKIPIFGICLGNQILALAAGGDTYKLKFGHRSHNQPCVLEGEKRCYITSQNHGYAVGKIPKGFRPWFINGNDGTNEGIIHNKLPFMSVQFHPEACPGPEDTGWLFDYFLSKLP